MPEDNKALPPAIAVPKRVALLTNILLSHTVAVMEALQPLVAHLRIFLSAVNEPERKMPIRWGNLDVVVQKSLRWTRNFTNVHGYKDATHIHVPYDTLTQLWSYRPDILISGQFGGRTLFATLYTMLRPKTKLIVWATLSQRTEATHGQVRTGLRKFILARADACFTHGKDAEAYLRGLGYRGPIFYTPYVIEEGLFAGESLVPDDGVLRVLYTGQFIERKGIYPFTVALHQWCRNHPDQKVAFRLGGQGPEQQRLEALPAPSNLEVRFLGHLDAEAIAIEYRTASIYAFPTLGDEWGMVVNEALSAGLPILASEHAQASLELIQDGVNGWLFDPASPESLANGLDRALSANRDQLQSMSRAARESVALWIPEVMANRMAAAMQTLDG